MFGRRRVVHVLGVSGWMAGRYFWSCGMDQGLHWEGLEVCVYLYLYGYLCAIVKCAVLLAIKA